MVEIDHKSTDGWVSKYLNRPISNSLTNIILRVWPSITPNIVSIAAFLLSIIASIFNMLSLGIIGGLFVQLSSILDGSDGEIARKTDQMSKFGDYFDSVLDRYSDIIIFTSILVLLVNNSDQSINLIIITYMSALGGSLLISYSSAKFKALGAPSDFNRTIAGRDSRLFIISIFLIASNWSLNILVLGLGIIGVITNIELIRRFSLVKGQIE
ncbi:MAG: CDP-alcohol phosphatidyltransferase family protein [Candidatus Heimdallarchaeota archaeon]|nr:CDP-alcohol phosphatidyltransferase family protein [Candidatus Heimdallarchaeota archaeon]